MFRGNYRGKQQHQDDFNLVLERGFQAGVKKIVITAGTLQEAKDALEMSRKDSRLYCTIGVHPTRCSQEFLQAKEDKNKDKDKNKNENKEKEKDDGNVAEIGDKYLAQLVELAKLGKQEGKIIAVGEFGLDYDRTEFCPKDVQKEWFARQLVALAGEVDLPLFLHCRAASEDMLVMLKEHGVTKGCVHSFDGDMETMRAMCALGLSIGINGCSLKTEDNLSVVREIPMERLLLETDGPWCDIRTTHPGYKHIQTMFPTVKKPKQLVESALGKCVKNRQEPCHLRQVLEVVAGVRDVTVDELAEQVYANTLRVFPGLGAVAKGTVTREMESGGSGGSGGGGSGGGGGGGDDDDDDDVQPFEVDEEFDFDNVELTGRRQTTEGWKEFATTDTYGGYMASNGGTEASMAKRIVKETNTKEKEEM